MSLFSLFSIAILTVQGILSPTPRTTPAAIAQARPAVSFGQLATTIDTSFGQLVLGDSILASTSPTPVITPNTVSLRTRKKVYTIALLGDSMIDTLGPDAPHMKKQLLHAYPGIIFTIHNFGVGGTNIDYGLERVTKPYTYLDKAVPSLVSTKPDIVVIESFGYNPYTYSNGALESHWLRLAAIVDELRTNLPATRIIIAATIAPNSATFGDGAPGIAFSASEKLQRTRVISSYLDSTVKFAQSQKLPLADAYHPSLDAIGNGKLLYINSGDHIHYSDAGRNLFGQKVTEAIIKNKLLE